MSFIDDGITLGDKTYTSRMAFTNDTIVLEEAPTTSTKGYEGQLCIVKLTNSYELYICVGVNNGSYIWKEISLS